MKCSEVYPRYTSLYFIPIYLYIKETNSIHRKQETASHHQSYASGQFLHISPTRNSFSFCTSHQHKTPLVFAHLTNTKLLQFLHISPTRNSFSFYTSHQLETLFSFCTYHQHETTLVFAHLDISISVPIFHKLYVSTLLQFCSYKLYISRLLQLSSGVTNTNIGKL